MLTSLLASTRKRLQGSVAPLRGWLIKIGLIPPAYEKGAETGLSDEQRSARKDLQFHSLPRPPRFPKV